MLGCLVVFGLNPLLGRWQKWSQLTSLQDRILGELARDQQTQIVLLNWPAENVQTLGVLTSTLPATDARPETAVVYCPSSPRATAGRILLCRVSDLQFTGWTLNEFQIFNWTLGTVGPEILQPEDHAAS